MFPDENLVGFPSSLEPSQGIFKGLGLYVDHADDMNLLLDECLDQRYLSI
jgi:hypothetical protein